MLWRSAWNVRGRGVGGGLMTALGILTKQSDRDGIQGRVNAEKQPESIFSAAEKYPPHVQLTSAIKIYR